MSCFAVGVDHQAVPPVSNVLLVCQPLRDQQNVTEQIAIVLCCIIERWNRLFRYDEDVHWRLWGNVAERKNTIVFVHDRGRYFSADDFRKNALAHKQRCANRRVQK